MTHYLVDGEPANSLPLDDRGVQFGDGLFETFAVQSGKAQFSARHFARLAAGCERLEFPAVNWPLLHSEMATFIASQQTGVLKIILTRGSSQRGYASDDNMTVRRILCFSDAPQWPGSPASRGVRARLCRTRLAVQPQLAGLKHLNRLEQVMARREWQDKAISEGLLFDTQGRLIEGTMSNLFLVTDGVLKTPVLDACGVAGVMRSIIIDVAEEASIPLEIGVLSRQDVQQASDVFLCNSLINIWPVVMIDTVGEYPVGTLTRRLQTLVQNYADHNNNNWYAK